MIGENKISNTFFFFLFFLFFFFPHLCGHLERTSLVSLQLSEEKEATEYSLPRFNYKEDRKGEKKKKKKKKKQFFFLRNKTLSESFFIFFFFKLDWIV